MDEQLAKEQLAKEQEKLSGEVNIPQENGYFPKEGAILLALDIQYSGDEAHVAGDLSRWQGEHIGTYAGVMTVTVPYVPTYFCFREGPPLLALIERLRAKEWIPELIVIDGHGLAHPRRLGVACWMGIATDIPTIGCAKDTILRYEGQNLEASRGSRVPMELDGETMGYCVRRQDGVKPIFASPGHLVTIDDSAKMAVELSGEFRVPDPIRRADHAARSHCKGESGKDWEDLGRLEPVKAPWEE